MGIAQTILILAAIGAIVVVGGRVIDRLGKGTL